MHRRLIVTAVVTASLLCLASSAAAAPIAPYDGDNPFRCKTQNTGFGVDYPNPDADPFCVKYNKTQQNLSELGIVDFLLNEPARVAAAVPKCFYHQTDHWTGWVVQGQQELWNWEGRYFFDKARGMGGVYIQNARVAGQPFDPRTLPGFPPEYSPYFGPGGGGVYTDTVAAEPDCAAKVDTPQEVKKVYRPAGATRSRSVVTPAGLFKPGTDGVTHRRAPCPRWARIVQSGSARPNQIAKARLAEVAANQWGVVSLAQLQEIGIGRAVLSAWVGEGRCTACIRASMPSATMRWALREGSRPRSSMRGRVRH